MTQTPATPRQANPAENYGFSPLPLLAQSTGAILEWRADGGRGPSGGVSREFFLLKGVASFSKNDLRSALTVH